MNKRRDLTARTAQVLALREIKPKVIRQSIFGDNHWDSIEAQIDVIENMLTYDEIDGMEESEEYAENVAESARDARLWLDGEDLESGPAPSDTWKELVR